MGGVFPRFPGSCDRWLADLNLEGCDLVCEPFAGSASLTVEAHRQGVAQAIVADADPSVRVALGLYRHPELMPSFVRAIRYHQQHVAADPLGYWQILKGKMEELIAGGSRGNIPELAAVSHTYRACAYAGIVRAAKSTNKLNVGIGKEQAGQFPRRDFSQLPTLPPGCQLHVHQDWQQSIEAIPAEANAFVLIDPPYYCGPQTRMEPCYPGHLPRNPETLALAIDSLSAALAHPGVRRVVMKNYCTPELEGFLRNGMRGWVMLRIDTGRLLVGPDRSAKPNRKQPPVRQQGFWYFYPTIEKLISQGKPLEPEIKQLQKFASAAPGKGWIETGKVAGRNFRQAWWRGVQSGTKNTIYIGKVGSAAYWQARSAQLAKKELKHYRAISGRV